MMSNRCGLTVVAALFLFGSSPNGANAGTMPGTGVRNIASAGDIASTQRSWAPIGHRQPRPSDIPLSAGLSPVDAELQRLDAEVDRKLIICHGC
jgi:hypothetical protein